MTGQSMAMPTVEAETPEQQVIREFFGPNPMTSPRMKRHMKFHMAQENEMQSTNYGERFLIFHRKFLNEFESFRKSRKMAPVQAWDPATEIPAELIHVPRITSDPFDADALCETPSWLTRSGGTLEDPLWSHTNLKEFASLDELGRSIDFDWHNRVHRTIGGDMSTMHMAPFDPVFWAWHKWIDEITARWEAR